MDRRSLNGQKKDAKLHDRWQEWFNVEIDTHENHRAPVVVVGELIESNYNEEWYGKYVFGEWRT